MVAEFDLDITGYNFIKLVVKMDPTSDANTSCAVAWGDACFYTVDDTPAHEHAASRTEKENVVDATCTSKGSYDEVVYCECGHEISRTPVTVDELAHTPKAPVIENKVDATCGADGSYDEVYYCECGEKLSTNHVVVPATGAHIYDEGVVTKEPTYSETGVKTYTCGTCGDTKEEILDKLVANVDMLYTTKTLFLKGAVSINVYLAFEGYDFLTQDYILANGGLLVWNAGDLPTDTKNAIHGSESYIASMEYSGPYGDHIEYMATTEGIPAKEYGDAIYFRSYIMVDGVYQYGELQEYSVKQYCEGRFEKSSNNKLKNTLVALLNYGAAAQVYLDYDTNNLVNADLSKYLANGWITQDMIDLNWNESYLTALKTPTAEMIANFTQTESFGDTSKSLFLKGAISTNYYTTIKADVSVFNNAQSQKMYFWTEARYNELQAAGIALSAENASYSVDAVIEYSEKYGYEYAATSDPIAAKNWGDTLYAALLVKDSTGAEHCSGVITYSPAQYAANKINNGKVDTVDPVCEWMIVYSQRAIAYFG
jgi:hypothetical protein